MPESTNVVSAPVEQDVPPPSYEDLMKLYEEQKEININNNKALANANRKLSAIEKQREKIPFKLYKIHRKIHYEWVNTIKARTVEEAKEIANSTSLTDLFNKEEWICVNKNSNSYKKKDDPVINPKTGQPFRKQKDKEEEKKVQSNKNTKSKATKTKKKNTKKK